MLDLLIENFKLIVLFVLIGSTILLAEIAPNQQRRMAARQAAAAKQACVSVSKSIRPRCFPVRLLVVAAALISIWTALPASAAVVFSDDIGGKLEDYTSKFLQLRRSSETIVIDGKCFSACTMLLGILSPNRICATQNAVLGFHAAWMYDTAGHRIPSPAGTRELMKTYPASIRVWLSRNGGLRPRMTYLQGRALAALVRPCAAGGAARRSARPSEAKR